MALAPTHAAHVSSHASQATPSTWRNSPIGQEYVQVPPPASNAAPPAQAVQSLAVLPAHSPQVASQAAHTAPLSSNLPMGHSATHVPLVEHRTVWAREAGGAPRAAACGARQVARKARRHIAHHTRVSADFWALGDAGAAV